MKTILTVFGALAILVMALGFANGTMPIGQSTILAGAIVLAGVLISAAIVENRRD